MTDDASAASPWAPVTAARWFARVVGGAALAGALIACVAPLREARWWYPGHGYTQPWALAWCALYVVGERARAARPGLSRALDVVWFAATAWALSGFAELVAYVLTHVTTGDLFYGVFLGAQRLRAGAAVYDMAGLAESVNASPFAITLLAPFGRMSRMEFLPWWLAAQVALLGAYLFYGWRWVVDARAARGERAGMADLGLLVATTLTFNSLQRSVRLGQLDLLMMATLAAGSYHLSRALSGRGPAARHGAIGGALVAVAVAVKILPAVMLGPPLVFAALHLARTRDGAFARSLAPAAVAFALTLGSAAALSVAVVSPREAARFVDNAALLSRGSSLGVNYAVVGRFAKYRDPSLRFRHRPLEDRDLALLAPLRAVTLALWAALAWRLSRRAAPLLFALGLASIPLVAPACWDVYYLWCGLLPWWVVSRSSREGRPRALLRGASPALVALLRAALVAGAYALMGLTSAGVVRELGSHAADTLDVPLWFDEARLAGLALLLALLAWELFEERATPA